MDVAQIFRELWRLRRWMLVGILVALLAALSVGYRVSFFPPGLHSKDLQIHTADTAVLVDGPNSVITDLAADVTSLAARANVYARFMTNLPVRRAIAAAAGLPVEAIVTTAPLAQNQPAAAREPVAAQRSQQLLGENRSYSLEFRTDSGLPTVSILAQAPTTEQALRLANAGAQGFAAYIRHVEAGRNVPVARRVRIRQLGPAEGGTVAKNVKTAAVVAAFVGVLLAWAMLVLLGANVARNWRTLDEIDGR